jgi:hypothetical protein
MATYPLTHHCGWQDRAALSRKGSEPAHAHEDFHHAINRLSDTRSYA